VLLAINNRLLEKGYYVMRYAARGSGSTTRRATFTGLQEGVDLQELVRWVRGEMTGVKTILLVVSCILQRIEKLRWILINLFCGGLMLQGYSFGALSASLFPILPDPEIKIHHILLSYPLGRRSLMTAFKSSHYATTLNNLLQNPQASVLVIYGNKDGVTSERSYDKWAEELKGQAKLEVMKIAGATHHWPEENGVRQSMLSIVEDWVP